MSTVLNNYVATYGEKAIFDTNQLQSYMLQNSATNQLTYQTLLVIECSSLKDFVEKGENKLSSVALNTLIINCVESTKLSYEAVRNVLFDILQAMHFSCNYENFYLQETPQPFYTHRSFPLQEAAFYSNREQSTLMAKATMLEKGEKYDEAYEIYYRLAKAGNSEAMYRIGLFYLKGLGTETNSEKALMWFENSAKNGNPKANKYIGDYHYEQEEFWNRDFSKAYECYTSPGVIAYEPSVKERIIKIINQKKTNVITLVISGIAVLLMWVFMIICHTTIHNAINVIGWGIALDVLATGILGVSIFAYFTFTYRNIKYLLPALSIIWAIYPLILVIN